MFSQTVGAIALNFSLLLYLIWFIPQLILTAKRRTTTGLSLSMHALLMVAYITDLVYGFGRDLPIQYKCVTLFGLSMLVIEHGQFLYFGDKARATWLHLLTLFFVLLFLFAIYHVTISMHDRAVYDAVGFFSWVCWLAFLWPQIMRNFINRSIVGCSVYTIWLVFLAGVGDCFSAFLLDWDWPSQVGATVSLLPKGLLLLQYFHYQKSEREFYVTAV